MGRAAMLYGGMGVRDMGQGLISLALRYLYYFPNRINNARIWYPLFIFPKVA